MKKKIAISTLFTVAAALFGITACATDESDGPDKGDHDQVGSGETCGGCDPSMEGVNDDGTINVCAPCDGTGITSPYPDDGSGTGSGGLPDAGTVVVGGGDGSGGVVVARLAPDGNKTQLQCREERDKALGECDREKITGNRQCDTDYANNNASCMQGVYQRCGTTSPYHYCVIAGQRSCTATNLPILQACNRDVEANYGRCRGAVGIDYRDCMLHANNRPSAILRLWQHINPF